MDRKLLTNCKWTKPKNLGYNTAAIEANGAANGAALSTFVCLLHVKLLQYALENNTIKVRAAIINKSNKCSSLSFSYIRTVTRTTSMQNCDEETFGTLIQRASSAWRQTCTLLEVLRSILSWKWFENVGCRLKRPTPKSTVPNSSVLWQTCYLLAVVTPLPDDGL